MVRICSSESAIATCDSYNWQHKLKHRHKKNKYQLRRFSYSDLESATSGFSPSSLLGKGSHGAVYRAVFDGGKLVAAVKRSTLPPAAVPPLTSSPTSAKATSFTGSENEIKILSKLRGPGLVNLLGYGVDPTTRRLLLVVEHMPNGSLYDLLHKNAEPPGWTYRVRFALRVAMAVCSLHESNPPVIHRDIKSSNVLIDRLGRARLGDFGLALRGHVEDVRALSTPPAGTLGYLDPCYLAPGDLSAKSDVFSFGILLLEIISGRRAIDVSYSPSSVVEWALPLIKAGKYEDICDRRIRCPVDRTLIRQCAILAVRCVRSRVEKRPTMDEVVDCLRAVYKRVRSGVWSGLKRRVEKSRPLIGFESFDGSEAEELVRRSRHGYRRSLSWSRKVSSVPSAEEDECEAIQMRTRGSYVLGGRSKSIGSVREMNMGSTINGLVNSRLNFEGRWATGVKIRRLSKSRSVGAALRGGKNNKLLHGNWVERGKQVNVNASGLKLTQTMEVNEFPLLINPSKDSPKKVSSAGNSNS